MLLHLFSPKLNRELGIKSNLGESTSISQRNNPGLATTIPDEGPDIPHPHLFTMRVSSQSSFPIVPLNRPTCKPIFQPLKTGILPQLNSKLFFNRAVTYG